MAHSRPKPPAHASEEAKRAWAEEFTRELLDHPHDGEWDDVRMDSSELTSRDPWEGRN